MEHFGSENLAVILLAGFSGLSLFKRGLVRVQVWRNKDHAHNPRHYSQNFFWE